MESREEKWVNPQNDKSEERKLCNHSISSMVNLLFLGSLHIYSDKKKYICGKQYEGN